MSGISIYTTEFLRRLITYADAQIASAKLLINDNKADAQIARIEIVNNNILRIYVPMSLGETDVINGIELYDENNVLLIKAQINLNFAVREATYMFEINLLAENILSTISL